MTMIMTMKTIMKIIMIKMMMMKNVMNMMIGNEDDDHQNGKNDRQWWSLGPPLGSGGRRQ